MSGLLLYLLLIGLLLHSSSADTPLAQSCEGGNYTSDSTYQSNLNDLLTFFTSLNSTFSNHTQGSDPDTAYGLFLCRGDVSPSDCRNCVQNAAEDVLFLCPSSKQATLWYDNCELRYSDLRFFGTVDSSPIHTNEQSFKSKGDNFIQLEMELLDKVTEHAAYNSSLMFATGTAVNGSDMVNGLAQCTRDLSMDSCSQCFQLIRTEYTGNENQVEGKVLGKSCNFIYVMSPFYQGNPTVLLNLTAPLTPPPSPFAISPPTPSISTGEGMGFLIFSLICKSKERERESSTAVLRVGGRERERESACLLERSDRGRSNCSLSGARRLRFSIVAAEMAEESLILDRQCRDGLERGEIR